MKYKYQTQFDYLPIILFGLALALALLTYIPAISGPFLFDDFSNLKHLAIISGHFTTERLGEYLVAWNGIIGRPLSALSFLIDDHSWPSDPESFKYNNILLHLLSGCFLFALTRQLLHANDVDWKNPETLSVIVLFVWLIHPLHVSTLMLVVQRMTILSNLFILIGLLLYVHFLSKSALTDTTQALLASSSLFIFGTLAFASKENGLLIFAFASVINLTLFHEKLNTTPRASRVILKLSTYLMTALIIVLLLWRVREPSMAYAFRDFTLFERLLSQARLFWIYLFEILIPNLDVNIFYDDFVKSTGLMTPASTLISVLAVIIATVTFIITRKTFPIIAFCIGWYFAGHLIESTVIPLEMRFDHRNYLAMYGPLLAIVLAIYYGLRNRPLLRWLTFASWILLTSAITFTAAKTWGNRAVLAQILYQDHPYSLRAAQNLVSEYLRSNQPEAALTIISNSHSRMPDEDVFVFMRTIAECTYDLSSKDDLEDFVEFSRDANYNRYATEIIAHLRPYIGSRCNGHLTPERYKRLLQNLISNPSFNRRPNTLAYLYSQYAKINISESNYSTALENIEKAYSVANRFSDLIGKAHVAVNAQMYCDALQTIRRSRNAERSSYDEIVFPREIQINRVLRAIPKTELQRCANSAIDFSAPNT